jgi:ribonuclease Z
MFGLTILGNNSALPAFNRHPTAQALTYEGQIFLIDCGEGTQFQIARYKVRRSHINHIFISHLHGDHYFGLVGIVTSMGLTGRHLPLHIYAPHGLEQIIKLQLEVASSILPFELHFHLHPAEGGILYNDGKIEVSCFPVQHRIPCFGFLFREMRKPRKINMTAASQNSIPASAYPALQSGEDYIAPNGKLFINHQLTIPGAPARSYAYTADTVYDPSIVQYFKGADLLYHEATYLHHLHIKAGQRFHSTARQAAFIAQLANAKKLLIGHYSSQYENTDELLREAKEVFDNTLASVEGVTYRV